MAESVRLCVGVEVGVKENGDEYLEFIVLRDKLFNVFEENTCICLSDFR